MLRKIEISYYLSWGIAVSYVLMTTPIFDNCEPRADVLRGTIRESDFAADLSYVLDGKGPREYLDPELFFRNSYPTRGLQTLLKSVCNRLTGRGGASIFSLNTHFGGGKTHGLIALVHAVRVGNGVPNISDFLSTELIPERDTVKVAAFDGDRSDPANGRMLESDLRAYTPWGELAYSLMGKSGYALVRESDIRKVAPGADTIGELFQGKPTLILLDELAISLRKFSGLENDTGQFTAFLSALTKAVENTSDCALVYTLATGKDARARDAYSHEHETINRILELESVSARKATLLNPTEDDETAHVLRQRLFTSIDEKMVSPVVEAYQREWNKNAKELPEWASRPETVARFRASYPFHPELLSTFELKVATYENFQRVRGMLRLLAKTVANMWESRPPDANAIHVHHIDIGSEQIREELLARLQLNQFTPAIAGDIVGDGNNRALAQKHDLEHYGGLPKYSSYVARTIFMNTLASHEQQQGVTTEDLRFSVLSPSTDLSLINDAIRRFAAEAAYLDDRAGLPHRFVSSANLNRIISMREKNVDRSQLRDELESLIKDVFRSSRDSVFNVVAFPASPTDVPDDRNGKKPVLAIMGYDAVPVSSTVTEVPELIANIFRYHGTEKRDRIGKNSVVFLAASGERKGEMIDKMARRIALRELKGDTTALAEHQINKVNELEKRSEQEVAITVQQCYRHLFYPTRSNRVSSELDLGHTVVSVSAASANPGAGQQQVVQVLQDQSKLQIPGSQPNAPTYVRDRAPKFKRNGEISTQELRDEFNRNVDLPILVGDDVFVAVIEKGVSEGLFVYTNGDLIWGKGEPPVDVEIADDAMVLLSDLAKERNVWPRRAEPTVVSVPTPSGSHASVVSGNVDSGVYGSAASVESAMRNSVTAEGVTGEVFTRLWEKINDSCVIRLKVEPLGTDDVFKVARVLKSLRDCVVAINANFVAGTSRCEITYEGNANDVAAVIEFIDSQFRIASDKYIELAAIVDFENGLAVDAAKKAVELLVGTKSLSAVQWHVEATVDISQKGSAR